MYKPLVLFWVVFVFVLTTAVCQRHVDAQIHGSADSHEKLSDYLDNVRGSTRAMQAAAEARGRFITTEKVSEFTATGHKWLAFQLVIAKLMTR